MKEHGIIPIDMVVVTSTLSKPPSPSRIARWRRPSKYRIGGPSMLRASAKNYPYVTVIVDRRITSRFSGR